MLNAIVVVVQNSVPKSKKLSLPPIFPNKNIEFSLLKLVGLYVFQTESLAHDVWSLGSYSTHNLCLSFVH